MPENPLGKATEYPDKYQPDLLVSMPRQKNRQALGLASDNLPFTGADVWNAYELSCLDPAGKPMVFIGRFVFSADSGFLVESKSMKLYLNSLNQEKFDNPEDFAETLQKDLGKASGADVGVLVFSPDDSAMPDIPGGICLDQIDIDVDCYEVDRSLLEQEAEIFEEITDEVLYTHLFRSNCPITNQPDWATITVCYRGRKIPHDCLLKYLVSYRKHNDYHENCVERIFCDLQDVYNPAALTVEANFLRRGGLDINPVRTTQTGLNFEAYPRYSRQ